MMTNKRRLSIVIVTLCVFILSAIIDPVVSYGSAPNIQASDWALREVKDAWFYGFIPSELSDVPLDHSVTREEFASLVVGVWEKETNTIVKLTIDNPFSDTEAESVLKAFVLGIVRGVGNGSYEPESTLTREEAATILTRLYLKLTEEEIEKANISPFQDDTRINGWAKESVYYMAEKGLLKGVGGNQFDPQGIISREQAIAISVRMAKEIFYEILNYVPEKEYVSGTRVYTLDEVQKVFKYAQYHLAPIITLRMDAGLSKTLEAEYSNIMTMGEITNISYSYSPGTQTLVVSMQYSLMAEVLALIINEDIKPARVSKRANETQAQLLAIRDSLISPEMDYFQREKAIHDYIVKNHSYDLGNRSGTIEGEESYSLWGLLKNRQGVCQGYAQLFWALSLNTKIPAGMVYGVAGGGPHAWNIVNIYGECYHVDVTWNDPIPDQGQKVRYDYYNLSEKEISRDHQWDCINNFTCDFVTYNN